MVAISRFARSSCADGLPWPHQDHSSRRLPRVFDDVGAVRERQAHGERVRPVDRARLPVHGGRVAPASRAKDGVQSHWAGPSGLNSGSGGVAACRRRRRRLPDARMRTELLAPTSGVTAKPPPAVLRMKGGSVAGRLYVASALRPAGVSGDCESRLLCIRTRSAISRERHKGARVVRHQPSCGPSPSRSAPKLPSYLPAHSPSERPVQYPREPLPRELAHLREARPNLSGLEPVLDIEDRGRILLPQSEWGGSASSCFSSSSRGARRGDGLVHNAPATLAHHIHRLHRATPPGVVARVGNHGPHRLRGLRDSDRFLDSHGDRREYRARSRQAVRSRVP